jgi:hypothetical protein
MPNVVVARVATLFRIQEVLCSNLDPKPTVLYRLFRVLPQSLEPNSPIVYQTRQWGFRGASLRIFDHVLGCSCRVDVNSVANVSELHTASIFGLELSKDGLHVQLTHGSKGWGGAPSGPIGNMDT